MIMAKMTATVYATAKLNGPRTAKLQIARFLLWIVERVLRFRVDIEVNSEP